MKQINNTIKINCETKDELKLEEMTEFQGELKAREDTDIDKVVRSIKKYGFSFPFFVWKKGETNYLLDGHGRYKALKKLDSLGFLIPPLPVVYVECKDEKSARDLLLRLNSQYGKMSKESVLEFIGDFELDLTEYELPGGTLTFDTDDMIDIDFGDGAEEKPSGKLCIIVECESEEEMETTFTKLHKLGYKCRMAEK